jgi:hypothetical protein
MESSNSRAALPRELHPSQNSDSPATNRFTPGVVVGNKGLVIRGFGSKNVLGEEARGGLETDFKRIMLHIKNGDSDIAIIAMDKFKLLMHQLDKKQLGHGLETLKKACSDSERGEELQYYASQTLDHVESELWLRLGALAETGKDKCADPEARINSFKEIEWIYPMLIMHLANRAKPETAVAGDAEEDGKVAAGLPAWNAEAIRIAAAEAAKARASSMKEGARRVEEGMAKAILTVAYAGRGEDDKNVIIAAEKALLHIDSPIMRRMMGTFQMIEDSSQWDRVSLDPLEGDASAAKLHHEFEIRDLDHRMRIGSD